MCGIFGIHDHSLKDKTLSHIVKTALNSMIHRGPDGQGTWGCKGLSYGMRRLAIHDIDGGQQPFFSLSGQVVAFQNGEIYNFRALKQELTFLGHHFKSECDTEVLAHGYVQWGMPELLRRIDGMFALAIYDQRTKRLFLARDRYGEKPLYWAHDGQRFAYSSTMTPLAALPWVDNNYGTWGLHRYLCLGFTPGDQTICKGIKRLLPGCWLEVKSEIGEISINRYHGFTQSSPDLANWDIKQLEYDLSNAVSSRLSADVPVGLFLSGGIDSSLLAHFAASIHNGLDTFSIGFTDAAYDESFYAKKVAEHVGSRHHHFIFDEGAFCDLLPKVASALDDPIGDQACLPLYLLSCETRKFATVVLSGEGADELFGGYSYYESKLAESTPQNCSLIYGKSSSTPSGFPHIISADLAAKWLQYSSQEELAFEHELGAQLGCSSNCLRMAKLCDICTWLPDDLLIKLDRIGMAASLEGRAPYLAAGLEHWTNLLPADSIRKNMPKYPLRLLAEKYLPNEVWNRPKQGFILPMREWLRTWFQLHGIKSFFNEKCNIEELESSQIINWSDSCLNDAKSGWERSLFSLVMLHEWHFQFHRQLTTIRRAYKL